MAYLGLSNCILSVSGSLCPVCWTTGCKLHGEHASCFTSQLCKNHPVLSAVSEQQDSALDLTPTLSLLEPRWLQKVRPHPPCSHHIPCKVSEQAARTASKPRQGNGNNFEFFQNRWDFQGESKKLPKSSQWSLPSQAQ